ncbi:hypothetical protein NSB04_21610, partial [Blautia pseudococcoides]|nr:hypothetical protein [Blautia pseudococcoides]
MSRKIYAAISCIFNFAQQYFPHPTNPPFIINIIKTKRCNRKYICGLPIAIKTGGYSMSFKIAFIGAGSLVFARTLFTDIMSVP